MTTPEYQSATEITPQFTVGYNLARRLLYQHFFVNLLCIISILRFGVRAEMSSLLHRGDLLMSRAHV